MKQKINYHALYDELVLKLKEETRTPTLLLHCCCAPCASHCLTVLTKSFDVSTYFFNPNIFPEKEYFRREQELQRLTKQLPLDSPVNTVFAKYQPQSFFNLATGLETAPEGGKRCHECFYHRLKNTAEIARQNGFEYFCTTLTVGPKKDSQLINAIGEQISKEVGIKWLFADFKKNDGFLHSIQLSKQYDLYRQNYCGCVFSKTQEQ